jgi:hypothetical protein
MPENPPQDASDLLETVPQIAALVSQASIIETARANRQLSDIPLNDVFWTTRNTYIQLDNIDENL